VSRGAVGRNLREALHLPLLVPAALLVGFGLVTLGGIEIKTATGWMGDLHVRQTTGVLIGLAAAVAAVLVPYKKIVERAYLIYAVTLLLLVVVLFAGVVRNDARRWLTLFGLDFQPSELMKLAIVLTLARFIRFKSSYKTFAGLGVPFVLTLLPMGLILLQPDLGTALLLVPILFTMLFCAGARLRHLGVIVVLGAAAILPVYEFGLKDYQRRRIDGFLVQLGVMKPGKVETRDMQRKELYQVSRARIAIGVGGLAGADDDGPDAHAALRVPERHNDFVFATVANRFGFLGVLVLLGLFVWMLAAILGVAGRQRDPAGRLLCVGVFALFAFQAFVNLAMNVGLLPVTGLTLPFLSLGRSSVVVSLLAIARVCNVAARPSYEFGRGDFD